MPSRTPSPDPLTSGNHLNGHSDLVFPEPFKDFPKIAGSQLPAECELLSRPLPVGPVGQGLGLVLEGQVGAQSGDGARAWLILRKGLLGTPHEEPSFVSNLGPCSAWEDLCVLYTNMALLSLLTVTPLGLSGARTQQDQCQPLLGLGFWPPPPTPAPQNLVCRATHMTLSNRVPQGQAGPTFQQGTVSRRPWDRPLALW